MQTVKIRLKNGRSRTLPSNKLSTFNTNLRSYKELKFKSLSMQDKAGSPDNPYVHYLKWVNEFGNNQTIRVDSINSIEVSGNDLISNLSVQKSFDKAMEAILNVWKKKK